MNKRILAAGTACLVLASLLAGCGGSYNAEKMYWHVSRKHGAVIKKPAEASEQDFKNAVEALKTVVKQYPSWVQAAEIQFYIGHMYASRKDYAAAEEELKKVYMNFPDNRELSARAQFGVGELFEQQGDWDRALKEYRQVVERYQTTSAGLQTPIYIARHYHEKKMPAESVKEFNAAIRSYLSLIEVNPFSPHVPVFQNLIIIGYAGQGKWQDAANTLEKLVERYPKSDNSPIALYRVARIYLEVLKQPEKAVAVYRRIITEYPNSKLGKNAQFELGNLSVLQGKMAQAEEEFGKVFDKYPDDASLCAVAQLSVAAGYQKSGRWEDALRELRRLQENYPGTLEALQVPLMIAGHYQQQGEDEEVHKALDEAIAGYRKILEEKSEKRLKAAAQDFTAAAYMARKQWPEAIDALRVLRQKYPNDQRAELALVRMGVIYQEGLKDGDKAKEMFVRFTQEYPNHRMVNVVKGMISKL